MAFKSPLRRIAAVALLAIPCLAAADNGVYSGAGGSFSAPTTTGQSITVSGVALSGTTATLTISCPITSFGAGTYQWNWKCAGGSIAATSTDSSLALSASFLSGTMTLSGSGGGRGGHVSYWYQFSGTFTGSVTLKGNSQAVMGSMTVEVKTGALLGSASAAVTGLNLGWDSEYSPLLVANAGSPRLLAADNLTGLHLASYGTWGSGTGQFENISGLARDASRRIYISDSSVDRLVRINNLKGTDWTELGSLGTGSLHFNQPAGVAIDSSGKIWVADAGNNRIVRFDDMAGANWISFGTAGSGAGQFSLPSAVAFDAQGRIYVADAGNGRLVRFDDLTGKNWTTLSTFDLGIYAYNLSNINGVAVLPSGQIVVSTAGNWVMRLSDMTGANPEVGYWSPSLAGIAADPAGALFVIGGFTSGLAETLGPAGEGLFTGTMGQMTLQASAVLSLANSITPPAAPMISTTALSFGNRNVGEPSAGQAITLTNFGGTPMPITSVTAGADYKVTDSCPSSLAGGDSCTVTVQFDPTTTGSRPGAVTISTSSVHPVLDVRLGGTGTMPQPVVGPGTLAFEPLVLNTRSGAERVLLTNTGTGPLSITSIAATGDFSAAGNCPAMVAPGSGCTIQVTFKPTATGPRTGTLTISDDAVPTGATQTVSLTGAGSAAQPAIAVSPGELLFPAQQVGVASGAQTITLTNTTKATIALGAPVFPAGFQGTNHCGTTLAAGTSCTIQVQFNPLAAGPLSGTISIPVTGQPALTVEGAGTGEISAATVLTVNPSPLAFNGYQVGDNPSLNLTIKNPSGVPVGIRSKALTGSGVFTQTGGNCPAILAGGASCTVNITFIPPAVNMYSATYTITEASGAKTAVSISGIATAGGGD